MTLEEYKDLDELEQLEVFWKATVVGEYSKDGFTYECRQVDGFYIEFKSDGGSALWMECHMDTDLLDPYLDHNDLNLEI